MIESVRYYIARCDRCKVSHIGVSKDRTEVVVRIKEAGWFIKYDGLGCLCPECREKEIGPKLVKEWMKTNKIVTE